MQRMGDVENGRCGEMEDAEKWKIQRMKWDMRRMGHAESGTCTEMGHVQNCI